jgi:diguanylate cyclase (GGDEF)-like protein/PAS domain S-box-containing protein
MNKHSLPASKIMPIRVVGIYAILGILWVFFSDFILTQISGDGSILVHLSVFKGLFFVLFTSVLIYILIRRATLRVIYDATKRKLAETELLKHKELLETASQAAQVALWEWDLSSGSLEWSAIVDPMLGYAPFEFPRTLAAWKESLHPDDREAVLRQLDAHVLDQVPYAVQYRIRKKDGTYIWWGDVGNCQRDADGKAFQMSGACVNISESRLAQDKLKAANTRFEDIIEFLPDATLIVDHEKKILAWNRAMEEMTGVPKENVVGRDYREASIPFYGKPTQYLLDFIEASDDEIASKYSMITRKGRCLSAEAFAPELYGGRGAHIWAVAAPLYDNEGRVVGMIESIRDITEQKTAEQALEKEHNLLRTLVDNIPDSIYVKDLDGRKMLTNRSDLDFIGVQHEADVLGKTDADVFPGHLASEYVKDDQNVLRNARSVINREEIVENSVGIKRWLLTSKIPLKDQDGRVMGLVGIGRDITERKLLESKLLTMAHYDSLTALPNRTLFLEKANMGMAHAKRSGLQCAILFVDLDHFKSVNDTLGHSIGDALLKDTAVKLAECVRETDVMARLGGDEFILLLNDLEDASGAQRMAERVREKLNVPRVVAGNDLFITASVGIVTYPHDGDTLEDLLKNADTAMYAAKEAGRNTYCFYDHVMNQKAVTKMQIERGLRDALVKNELALFYQPIVSVKDGKVRGFEALLRWFKVEGGLVLPNEFIPVAEETGLIIPIGEWVLYEACRFNRMLMDAGYPDMIMSVNISVAQLRRKNIVDTIKSALQASGLPAKNLEIEVTESMFIDSLETAVEVLNSMRALGVQISLDDFGTGYSSLVHLQRLPIANLKIDRLFIKEIAKDTDQNAMIPAIIDLAHKLKLSVVAEGVETDVQLERLLGNQCDFFQGFLLSRPMPEVQVIPFLQKEHAEGI